MLLVAATSPSSRRGKRSEADVAADVSALHSACKAGRVDDVKLLLAARIDVDARDADGDTALCHACEAGMLQVVQLLSAHGARRARVRSSGGGLFAEEAAEQHEAVAEWLRGSRTWSTALHHAPVLAMHDVIEILRSGADLGARRYSMANAPSPLDVALQQPSSPGSRLVIQAAAPWSPATHYLFPAGARQRAAALLRLGYLLVFRNVHKLDAPGGLLDAWMLVMQFLVTRRR